MLFECFKRDDGFRTSVQWLRLISSVVLGDGLRGTHKSKWVTVGEFDCSHSDLGMQPFSRLYDVRVSHKRESSHWVFDCQGDSNHRFTTHESLNE